MKQKRTGIAVQRLIKKVVTGYQRTFNLDASPRLGKIAQDTHHRSGQNPITGYLHQEYLDHCIDRDSRTSWQE